MKKLLIVIGLIIVGCVVASAKTFKGAVYSVYNKSSPDYKASLYIFEVEKDYVLIDLIHDGDFESSPGYPFIFYIYEHSYSSEMRFFKCYSYSGKTRLDFIVTIWLKGDGISGGSFETPGWNATVGDYWYVTYMSTKGPMTVEKAYSVLPSKPRKP